MANIRQSGASSKAPLGTDRLHLGRSRAICYYIKEPKRRSSEEERRRNAERQAVEFGVKIGEYRGVVRVPQPRFVGAVTPKTRIAGWYWLPLPTNLAPERDR